MSFKEKAAELNSFFMPDRKVIIMTHQDPDYDAIGSSIAMHLMLGQLNIESKILMFGNIDPCHQFLPYFDSILQKYPTDFEYNMVICLDASNLNRIKKFDKLKLTDDMPIINIDHHQDNNHFGDFNYVPKISSVGELLFQLAVHLDVQITPEMATCLYAAIVFDTDRFYHSNVTSQTLHTASQLAANGANPNKICERMYETQTPKTLDTLKEALSQVVIDHDLKFAYTYLTKNYQAGASKIIDHLSS